MDTPIDFIKHTKEIKNKDGVVFSCRPQYKIIDNEINYSGYYYIQYCKTKSPQGTKTLDFRSITQRGDIITIINNPEETKNHGKIENIILESNQLNNTQIYGNDTYNFVIYLNKKKCTCCFTQVLKDLFLKNYAKIVRDLEYFIKKNNENVKSISFENASQDVILSFENICKKYGICKETNETTQENTKLQ